MSVETICSNIITKMSDFEPDVIYLAVGCFMGYYKEITPSNNQQDPLFLQPFADKKRMYIFFDPLLENPLKLESQLDLLEIDNNNDYRVLENDKLVVFAVKHPFYFYAKNASEELQKNHGLNKILLATLILYTIEKKKKMFVQDYTGADINSAYSEFFDMFPKEDIFKHVMFDITHDEGGCFVDFTKYKVHYDSSGNFVQLKYLSLTEMKKYNEEMFKSAFHKRIGWVNYHLSRQIRVINKEIEGNQYDVLHIENILKNLSMTYSITNEVSIENLENAIMYVIIDFSEALELPRDILKHITDNKYNQKIITDTFLPIKSLVGY